MQNLSPAPVSKTSALQCNEPTGGPPTCDSSVLTSRRAAWRRDDHTTFIFSTKVSAVTRLRAGLPTNRSSLSFSSRGFFSLLDVRTTVSPIQPPHQYRLLQPELTRPACKGDAPPRLVAMIRTSGALTPLPLTRRV